MFSDVINSSVKDDTNRKALNDMQSRYAGKIMNEVDTLQLQLTELDLVQKIQYQYDVYALDTEALFSKNAMKAVAQTLSELIFKDIKVCYDLAIALKSSGQEDIKFVFDTDSEATNILEVTSWDVLNVQKTTFSLPVLQDYAAFLMSQSFLDASNVDSDEFYHKDLVMKQMGMISLANYETSKLYGGEDAKWGIVKDIVGIDNADVRSIQLTMFTISDFLQKMDKDGIFPEEIRQLMNFDNGFVMDKMIYPALASFVHLRQGFDRFL